MSTTSERGYQLNSTHVIILVSALLILVPVTTASNHNLMAHWPMDAGSGQDVADLESSIHDGIFGYDDSTEPYDPVWDTSDYQTGGASIDFDGSEDFVTIDDHPDMRLDTVSAVAWVKPDTHTVNDGQANAVFTKISEFKMGIHEDGQFVMAVDGESDCSGSWCHNSGDGYGGWVPAGWTVPTGEWTEVGFTWNTTHFIPYRNGERMDAIRPGTLSGSTNIYNHDWDLVIGAKCADTSASQCTDESGVSNFNGHIDDLRIYEEALPEDDPAISSSAPETSDDYDDAAWENTAQDIIITCSDDDDDCENIRWRVEDSGGNILRPTGSNHYLDSAPSTTADVGTSNNGELYLVYWGEDAEGNVEDPSNSQRVRIDTVDPSIDSLDHSPEPPTNSDTVTISGSASDDESSVTETRLYADGTLEETCSSSSCSTAVGPFSAGSTHSYRIEADDAAGNTVSSDGSFTVNQPPAAPTNPDPSDGATLNTASPDLAADYSDPDGDSGQLYYYDASDDSLINSCSVTDGNRCSVTWSGLSDGQHAWYAIAEDTHDDTAQSSTWTFTVDTSTSTQITGPSASDWYSDDVTVTVDDANDAQTCEWQVDDGNDGSWDSGWTSRPCPDGSFTMTVDDTGTCSAEGNNACRVQVRAEDAVDNSDTDEATFNIDRTEPTTTITDPDTSDWYGSDFDIDVSDTDSGGSGIDSTMCEYRINDSGTGGTTGWQSRSCDTADAFTVPVGDSDLCSTEGMDTCTVETRASDTAGNSDRDMESFNIDYSGPQTTDNYTDDEWKTSPQPIELTCTDTGGSCSEIEWEITTHDDTTVRGPQTDSGSSTEVTVGAQEDGELYLHYRGIDGGGNQESPWNTQRVRIDTEAVVTNITSPSTEDWYNDDFTVTIEDRAGESFFGGLDVYYRAYNSQTKE